MAIEVLNWARMIGATFVVAMYLTPACRGAQSADDSAGREAGARAAVDLGYVTPETVATVLIHPRRVLTAPEMEMLPIEVISAAGRQELGIDPLDIEQVLAIVELSPENVPDVAVVLRSAKPLEPGEIFPALWRQTVEAELAGRKYRQAQTPATPSIFRPDDRTVILARERLLRKIVHQYPRPPAGEMSRILERISKAPDILAITVVAPLRPQLKALLAQAPLPPPLAGLAQVPDQLKLIGLRVNLVDDAGLSLTLRAEDEAAAAQLDELIGRLLETARQMMLAGMAEQMASSDPVEQASARYVQRLGTGFLQTLRPRRTGDTLALKVEGQGQLRVAAIGALAGLALPAMQAARAAARRSQSSSNLKRIGVALHMYHDVHRALPARANFDAAGKPLLSWRVHLLPFLEEQTLYERFRLDEPWDSPHNRELIPLMPALYRNPGGNTKPGLTHYLGAAGDGMLFSGDKSHRLSDIIDGTSTTIMVLEVDDSHAAVWTQPDDLAVDANRPLAGLGAAHPGGFLALLADDSVRFISEGIDPRAFRAMLTIAGGDLIGPF